MQAERFGNILLRQGIINAQTLEFCLKVQKNNGWEKIGCVLKHYDFIDETHIANALAEQVGWVVFQGEYILDEDIFNLFGQDFFLEQMVFPVKDFGKTVFVLSRTDNIYATDIIQSRLRNELIFKLAPESILRNALSEIKISQSSLKNTQTVDSIDDNLLMWLEQYIEEAINRGATDIHIEPSQKAVEMRFRIDGIMYFIDSLRLVHLPRLVNVIFHKADVTISDFGHFHDARFTHQYMNRTIDIRVSHIPSIHGSSVVLRLLDKGKAVLGLTELGYGPKQWALIQDNLRNPQGLTLIIGPTGCGKTTTLYAILNHLKSISRKIVTIEDPVEIQLPLMTQVQINDRREISFSSAIRSFLRHDPNIILVGEIRDEETAKEAFRAAMTGHKVFATLHANRPVDAILRLHDLGVSYTHMAGNLSMLIAQRLLRRLCPSCKGAAGSNKCTECYQGYKGRIIASEVLSIDGDIESILSEGNIVLLRKHIKELSRYHTIFQDAKRLIDEGMISVEESERILG